MQHTCGALRTMRSMQRTPHIVRRLVLGVQHATCSMQRAAYSVQHAPRPIPTAAMRSQPPPLSERNLQHPACNTQRASIQRTPCTMQRATSQCNMHYPTGPKTGVVQPATCNPKCNIVCTPCNIKRARTVRSKRCNKQHTPCNVQRTPCNVLMQHAQLAATRIAHRRRACDAAALEAERPTVYPRHATILHTAAPTVPPAPVSPPLPHAPLGLRYRRSPRTRT